MYLHISIQYISIYVCAIRLKTLEESVVIDDAGI